MLPEIRIKYASEEISAELILRNYEEDKQVLIPEAVGILYGAEWNLLQAVHDEIALCHANSTFHSLLTTKINELALFTIEELETAAL